MLRLTRLLVIGALAISLGAHWALLQAVAWAGMLYSYSQQAGVKQAVAMTFDGEHPCCLCKAIQAGKAQEREQRDDRAPLVNDLKLDLPPAKFVFHHPPCPAPCSSAARIGPEWDCPPERPPPRQV
jgi:hypothetical protein